MLETVRFRLKPVEEIDLHELLELQWDRDVMKLMNFKPLSMGDQREWFKSIGKNCLYFSVFEIKENKDQLIGLASLNQIDHFHQRASWGLKLMSGIYGKGIGYEIALILLHFGFSNLNLIKIHGDRVSENIGSVKMCSKLGMREEGRLLKHCFQNGEFKDLTLIGILKEEFYNHNLSELKRIGILDNDFTLYLHK